MSAGNRETKSEDSFTTVTDLAREGVEGGGARSRFLAIRAAQALSRHILSSFSLFTVLPLAWTLLGEQIPILWIEQLGGEGAELAVNHVIWAAWNAPLVAIMTAGAIQLATGCESLAATTLPSWRAVTLLFGLMTVVRLPGLAGRWIFGWGKDMPLPVLLFDLFGLYVLVRLIPVFALAVGLGGRPYPNGNVANVVESGLRWSKKRSGRLFLDLLLPALAFLFVGGLFARILGQNVGVGLRYGQLLAEVWVLVLSAFAYDEMLGSPH